jgi:hypothetical protein
MPGRIGGGRAIERRGRQAERRRRLADQHGDRMFVLRPHHADVGVLHPRRVELRLRLRHIRHRREAALQAVPGHAQRIGVRLHGVVQQALLRVGAAHFDVVEGQLRVQAEARGFEVGGGGLRLLARRRDRAADLSPQIDFVG